MTHRLCHWNVIKRFSPCSPPHLPDISFNVWVLFVCPLTLSLSERVGSVNQEEGGGDGGLVLKTRDLTGGGLGGVGFWRGLQVLTLQRGFWSWRGKNFPSLLLLLSTYFDLHRVSPTYQLIWHIFTVGNKRLWGLWNVLRTSFDLSYLWLYLFVSRFNNVY